MSRRLITVVPLLSFARIRRDVVGMMSLSAAAVSRFFGGGSSLLLLQLDSQQRTASTGQHNDNDRKPRMTAVRIPHRQVPICLKYYCAHIEGWKAILLSYRYVYEYTITNHQTILSCKQLFLFRTQIQTVLRCLPNGSG